MIFKISLKFLAIFAVVSAKSLKIPIEKKIIPNGLSDNSAALLFPVDQNGLYYVTNITIGTPPQLFTVGFSNYIGTSFLPSITCITCKATNVYDETKSSTYTSTNSTLSILLDNSERTTLLDSITLESPILSDHLNLQQHRMKENESFVVVSVKLSYKAKNQSQIASMGIYTIQNQLFADVVKETNYDLPLDGMISLALNENNIIFNMRSQELISDPIVGYFISATDGEISFGEPDLNHYSGDMNYINLSLGPTWALPVDNYGPNNDAIKSKLDIAYMAVFDVAVQNIESSSTTIKQINEALGADLEEDGSYTFDCNKLDQYSSFTFVFNGIPYVLDPKDYTQIKDSKCISYFVSNSFSGDAVFNIGQPFFRKYYTVFDFGNERMGFATAN